MLFVSILPTGLGFRLCLCLGLRLRGSCLRRSVRPKAPAPVRFTHSRNLVKPGEVFWYASSLSESTLYAVFSVYRIVVDMPSSALLAFDLALALALAFPLAFALALAFGFAWRTSPLHEKAGR